MDFYSIEPMLLKRLLHKPTDFVLTFICYHKCININKDDNNNNNNNNNSLLFLLLLIISTQLDLC